ncbi:MAG: PadR family transcriptional regulator [Alphaproteobacteria bacterium]|nr:PadR family transcriptional regulator [Alphaproteobacteria bacterium]MCZ6590479.1 PadR family transcriptional regulator [Alphaproteobacteria bacterium]MCZ6838235.1 PadR family transcriptional regulator [Alphaproteobacteria bacterium]
MDTKILCLGVLTHGDASGYEIKKAFEDGPFGHIQEIGFGSIYPALAKLLKDNLVTVTKYTQEGRPDKKVYRLTATGRLFLLDALDEPTEPDKVRSDFLFRMMFAHLLSPSALEAMISERMAVLNTAIERLEQCADDGLAPASEVFINGYALAIYRAMADYIEEHRYQLVGASLVPERAVAE